MGGALPLLHDRITVATLAAAVAADIILLWIENTFTTQDVQGEVFFPLTSGVLTALVMLILVTAAGIFAWRGKVLRNRRSAG